MKKSEIFLSITYKLKYNKKMSRSHQTDEQYWQNEHKRITMMCLGLTSIGFPSLWAGFNSFCGKMNPDGSRDHELPRFSRYFAQRSRLAIPLLGLGITSLVASASLAQLGNSILPLT
jgi:hypothetical protein